MSLDLRQRRGTNPNSSNNNNSMPSSRRVPLSQSSLLKASPQEHGAVYKLHVPVLYSILPTWLQKWIASLTNNYSRFFWFVSSFLAPRWEPRYLVLLGSYLYKFKTTTTTTSNETNNGEQEPKGAPVHVDAIDVYLVQDGHHRRSDLGMDVSFLVPPNSNSSTAACVFCVSTFRKQYYYAVADHQQAIQWVNSLRQAREEAVRRSMGHAMTDSYPATWTYYDKLCDDLCQRKDRVRRKMEERNWQELEMSQLTAEGGPLPRGYYG